MSAPHLSPSSANSHGLFFPSSQPTPDNMYSLSQRKQQLAHLQNLQRQQQQMLHLLNTPQGSMNSTRNNRAVSPVMTQQVNDERNDRFSSSGMRSHPTSPISAHSGSVVHFAPAMSLKQNQLAECDYDINPTELYLAVQKKDWELAAERAVDYPQEAATWVSRKEGDGKLRWRLLPLHAAIIFKAPEKAIGALLMAFAQGAACKDDQGMLPIHLAFRNGCDGEVVNLLLMAYPQSVDVQDRKGRVPMVLAQQSSHPNREVYIRAIERGAAYYAVANAAKDGSQYNMGGTMMMDYQQQFQGPPLTESERSEFETTKLKVDQIQVEYAEKITELEAELAKTHETSQVLVDHVNSLEAQIASRTDTERFLATKIANLDKQLTQTTKQLEETEANLQANNAELEETNASLKERAEKAEADAEEYKLALDDKREVAQKVYKLTNKERFEYEDRMAKCEREAAAHQANAAVLEAQLKKKIETEHSLASQVSMLAAQLAASASNASEANSSYGRKCEILTAENKQLKDQITELKKKLSTVAAALDAMATEQERIVSAATRHERTMAAAAEAHHRIVSDTARQESLLEDAAKEREQIVAILMRQAEDAERTMAERERVIGAVKDQERDMLAAAEERDLVVDSVNKQREYMDFMLNGELRFLKMTESEEEQEEVVEERKAEMEKAKEEYLAKAEAEEAEEVDNEEAEEAEEEEEDASPETEKEEEDVDVSDNEDDDDADRLTEISQGSRREAELKAQIAIEEAMLRRLKEEDQPEEEEEQPEEEEEQPEEEEEQPEEEEEQPKEEEVADATDAVEEDAAATEEFHDAEEVEPLTAAIDIIEDMQQMDIEDDAKSEAEEFVGDVTEAADAPEDVAEATVETPAAEDDAVVEAAPSDDNSRASIDP